MSDTEVQLALREVIRNVRNCEAWQRLLVLANRHGLQVEVTGNINPGSSNPYFGGRLIEVNPINQPGFVNCELVLRRGVGGGSIFANEVIPSSIRIVSDHEADYQSNPLPPNYMPYNQWDVYEGEPLDLIDDTLIDLLHASEYLLQDIPLYVGKYLMDACYRLNQFMEVTGNDPTLLEIVATLKYLATLPHYQSPEVREELLKIVDQFQYIIEGEPYLTRLGSANKLSRIRRALLKQRTSQDEHISDAVREIQRILRRSKNTN